MLNFGLDHPTPNLAYTSQDPFRIPALDPTGNALEQPPRDTEDILTHDEAEGVSPLRVWDANLSMVFA